MLLSCNRGKTRSRVTTISPHQQSNPEEDSELLPSSMVSTNLNFLDRPRFFNPHLFWVLCFPFVALVALENMGFVANMVSLVLYFSYKMYFDLSTAANTLTNLMGSTFLLSIVGGFISDTFLNRFQTCVIFGALEVSVNRTHLLCVYFWLFFSQEGWKKFLIINCLRICQTEINNIPS